jgi:hypothetical protein
MATYDKTQMSQGNVKSGMFTVYSKINFTQHNMADADFFRLAKLKDGWIVMAAFYRMTVSASAATMDLGITKNGTGQEIKAGLDISTATTDWTVSANTIDGLTAYGELGDDTYVTCEAIGAAVADGVLEIMILCLASPADSEPCDMNIDD